VAVVGDAQSTMSSMIEIIKKNIQASKALIKKKLVTGGNKLKLGEKKNHFHLIKEKNYFTSACSS
jgi:hypothetical protein